MVETRARNRGAWTIMLTVLGLFLLVQGINTTNSGAQATYFGLAMIEFIVAASVWSGQPRLSPAARMAMFVALAVIGVVALVLWLFFVGSGAAR